MVAHASVAVVVAGRLTLFGGARFDLQVGERIEGATANVIGRIHF